ncbi:50S ribosomal protein L28 [Candidatus Gracilibacteria bacterium]|nr:50S ribosomal protein L28 [Candidatus Gracilibacteria bacterium]
MSRKCQLTGKKTTSGQNRPFSLKATKRTFRPNLFRKRMLNPLTGKVERMQLSAKAIRTLKKWARESMSEEEKKTVVNTGPVSKNEEKNPVKKEKLTPKQKKELKALEEEKAKNEAAGVKEEDAQKEEQEEKEEPTPKEK